MCHIADKPHYVSLNRAALPGGNRTAASPVVAGVPDTTSPSAFAAERFSPMRFDESHCILDTQIDTLLDAARRAPSAGNSQPWAFVVGRRGDDVHERLVRHLAPSTVRWAPGASLLLANLSQQYAEGSTMAYSEFAHYDLGQAVAHLTFQAHEVGLAVHQFRAFDRAGLAADFGVPPHWEVTSMAAVGVPLGPVEDHVGAGTSRERRARADITWARAARQTPPSLMSGADRG